MFKNLMCFGIAVALAAGSHTAAAKRTPLILKIAPAATAVALADPAAPTNAAQPETPSASRGELLYTTHCISCHTTEMHWRDKRVANNWIGLKKQVRRWQDASSLAWSEIDITEVARYLNETIYLFEQTVEPVSSLSFGGSKPSSTTLRASTQATPDPSQRRP